MNIILSRKGFDSTLRGGGYPNWIYNNRFYPIPIPENGTGIQYDNLKFDDNNSYLDVMVDLNVQQYTECHLDPNLGYELLNGDKLWRNCLGQIGNSNNSLKSNGVDSNSIFLFFSWFKHITKNSQGKFSYTKNKKSYPTGMHAIYGYLEVSERIDLDINDNFDKNQPHCIFRNVNDESRTSRHPESNSIYVASEKCSFNKKLDGSGIFNFNNDLILTEQEHSRSNWKLPFEVFEAIDNNTTYLHVMKERQKAKSNKIKFNTQGQEIIFKDAHANLEKWAKNLIKENHI